MDGGDEKFRVFISYSHADRETAERIVGVLDRNGLLPLWDDGFAVGTGFDEQIRYFIAHSHVFLPLITDSSSSRGWVHQEIGYAMALNIPILPVVLGSELPQAMMQRLLAVRIDPDLQSIEQQLSYATFRDLVNRFRDPSLAIFECAPSTEQRAALFVQYSQTLEDMGVTGCVRQKGGLSSFHMPNKRVAHEVWSQRYGGSPPTVHHRELLLSELRSLQGHAAKAGCKLIVDPTIEYQEYGNEARRVRLQCLISFLEAETVSDVQIAVYPKMPGGESVTVVGSYFCAQAMSGDIGHYRQTIFTRHAPSMNTVIERFDREFYELLDECGWTAESSRESAIGRLREEITKT